MMQTGLGASVLEASSLQNDGGQKMVQLDDRQSRHDERQHQENRRHNREMQRHHNENERDWHDRQGRENQRHDNTMNEIEAGLIGIVIGSLIN